MPRWIADIGRVQTTDAIKAEAIGPVTFRWVDDEGETLWSYRVLSMRQTPDAATEIKPKLEAMRDAALSTEPAPDNAMTLALNTAVVKG